ncbi:MAG: hypothetical protein WAO00_19305, partial [Chthoniobacterales bacterium]
MKQMRLLALIAFAIAIAGGNALAQETANAKDATPAVIKETEENAWSFSTFATTYFVPDDREYVQPTFSADRG